MSTAKDLLLIFFNGVTGNSRRGSKMNYEKNKHTKKIHVADETEIIIDALIAVLERMMKVD